MWVVHIPTEFVNGFRNKNGEKSDLQTIASTLWQKKA